MEALLKASERRETYTVTGVPTMNDLSRCEFQPEEATVVKYRGTAPRGVSIRGRRVKSGRYTQGFYGVAEDGSVEPDYRNGPAPAWVGELVKLDVERSLIGPLSAAEWCSLRLGADDDPFQCCAETSELRDAAFTTLRMGGEERDGIYLHAVWHDVTNSHGDLTEHPVMRKLHDFYIAGKEPLPPESALAELFAVSRSYASDLIRAACEAFDLGSEAGKVLALSRLAPKLGYVLDADERASAVAEMAAVLEMSNHKVACVVDVWRASVGLLPEPVAAQ